MWLFELFFVMLFYRQNVVYLVVFFFCLSPDCVVTTTVTNTKNKSESETYTLTAAVWISNRTKNLCFILKW